MKSVKFRGRLVILIVMATLPRIMTAMAPVANQPAAEGSVQLAQVPVGEADQADKQATSNSTASAKAQAVSDAKAAAQDAGVKQKAADAAAADAASAKDQTIGNYPCNFSWNDCDWQYSVIGGGEESASSSQDSQTNPFVTAFVRAPSDNRLGSVWLLARFLGAANANNTNNVVAATQSATGSSSTSGLPQVGTAVDYAIGMEHDFFMPNDSSSDRKNAGGFTIGMIASFGATTPLSAQHATTAFVVPAYGTNECSGLLARFPANKGQSGLPVQPGMPYITTTTASGGTSTVATSGPFCIVNPVATSTTTTTNGVSTTVTTSGTAQTDIAFAPEDRSSFLLKYAAGLRLINRWHSKAGYDCGSDTSQAPCVRTVADLTIGQDEAITGGMLRHWVAKADATFPISTTGVYFFGAASLRVARDQNLSPLILQPSTIVTSMPVPPTTVTVPSTSTWVLPLTQPNRDFYRVGLGYDLTPVLKKLKPPS